MTVRVRVGEGYDIQYSENLSSYATFEGLVWRIVFFFSSSSYNINPWTCDIHVAALVGKGSRATAWMLVCVCVGGYFSFKQFTIIWSYGDPGWRPKTFNTPPPNTHTHAPHKATCGFIQKINYFNSLLVKIYIHICMPEINQGRLWEPGQIDWAYGRLMDMRDLVWVLIVFKDFCTLKGTSRGWRGVERFFFFFFLILRHWPPKKNRMMKNKQT